jgi:hypothetical protein
MFSERMTAVLRLCSVSDRIIIESGASDGMINGRGEPKYSDKTSRTNNESH